MRSWPSCCDGVIEEAVDGPHLLGSTVRVHESANERLACSSREGWLSGTGYQGRDL